MIRGLLIKNREHKSYEYHNIDDLKKELGIDTITAIRRKVIDKYANSPDNNEWVYIICDDEGKLKNNLYISGVCYTDLGIIEELVGPLFICKLDSNNQLVTMSDKDYYRLCDSIKDGVFVYTL